MAVSHLDSDHVRKRRERENETRKVSRVLLLVRSFAASCMQASRQPHECLPATLNTHIELLDVNDAAHIYQCK